MLPAYRVLGDDGTLVSAREICASTGIDLALLQRMHRAIGLPRTDDPDAAVLPRADAEAVKHAKAILDLGYDPEDAVAVMRVLVQSLGQAAAMMREAALKTCCGRDIRRSTWPERPSNSPKWRRRCWRR